MAAIKSFFNMTAEDAAEFDAWVALAPGTGTGRLQYLNRSHSVLILANTVFRGSPPVIGAPGYDTPAAVRSKLGL